MAKELAIRDADDHNMLSCIDAHFNAGKNLIPGKRSWRSASSAHPM